MNYSRVVLLGRLTRDLETKQTASGLTITTGSIAVNERRKDPSGELVDDASFFDWTAFGKTAETLAQFFRKGQPILLEGTLKQDRWQDKTTGDNRSKVKVNVTGFSFVQTKAEAQAEAGAASLPSGGGWHPSPGQPVPAPARPSDDFLAGNGPDVPF